MKSLNSFINFRSSRPNLQSSYISLDRRLTVGSPSGLNAKWMLKLVAIWAILLTVGVGNVWGDTDTYDFNTNGITKISGPNSGAVTTSSPNVVFTSKTGNTTDSWTIAFTANTFYGYGKGNGVNFGANSKSNKYPPHATLTSKSYNNVTDVTITYSGNSAVTLAVSVGGTSFGSTTSGSSTSHTFSHAATTGAVVISVESSTNGQFKINSVTITYSDTPPCTPLGSVNGSVPRSKGKHYGLTQTKLQTYNRWWLLASIPHIYNINCITFNAIKQYAQSIDNSR